MTGAITRCRILTPDETFESGTIAFDDSGRITAVGPDVRPPPTAETTDARGMTIVPGFIDLHVHGGSGHSLATRDAEEIRSYARWVVSRGVTSFLPTVFGASVDEGLEYARIASEAAGPVDGGAHVLGVNLEGPFVNPDWRGALPAGWVTPPDVSVFERLAEAAQGQLRLMTVAAELTGAGKLITKAVGRDVTLALGHSMAGYQTAALAFSAGASHVTHVFNAMSFHHRDPGIIGAAFDSAGTTIEVIADGVHLHPVTIAMLVKAVGPDRIVLVTDGVPPAGVDGGTFRLGDVQARLAGDRVLLPDGTIAGGAATMCRIVRNVVHWRIASPADAVRMASTVPARILGLADRKGRIAIGYDADLVALDPDLEVVTTWVRGRVVYSRT